MKLVTRLDAVDADLVIIGIASDKQEAFRLIGHDKKRKGAELYSRHFYAHRVRTKVPSVKTNHDGVVFGNVIEYKITDIPVDTPVNVGQF